MNTIDRGIEAQRLLENEVLQEAFEDVRQIYLDASLNLPLHEKYHQERALTLIAINVVDAVTSHLRTAIAQGKDAVEREAAKDLKPKRIVRKF